MKINLSCRAKGRSHEGNQLFGLLVHNIFQREDISTREERVQSCSSHPVKVRTVSGKGCVFEAEGLVERGRFGISRANTVDLLVVSWVA